jgi:hypothetical protein
MAGLGEELIPSVRRNETIHFYLARNCKIDCSLATQVLA